KPWVTFRPSAEERRAGDLCCDGSRTLLSLSNPNKRTHSTRRNRVALGLRSYSSLTLSLALYSLTESPNHTTIIVCCVRDGSLVLVQSCSSLTTRQGFSLSSPN